MPVRSLTSSVLKWPEHTSVDRAVRAWANEQMCQRPELVRIGYFGSYARGNWGVGSDLDVVVVVRDTREPFERRAGRFDTMTIPVPCDVLVYTEQEWQRLRKEGGRFARMLEDETVWVSFRADETPAGRGNS